MELKYLLITGIAITALVAIGATMHFMQPKVYHDQATLMYHAQIENISKEVNSKQTTWKAGVNTRWLNMGKDAIKGQMGVKKLLGEKAVKLRVVSDVIDSIPASFDARDAWPKCDSIKEVRDQSNCGSCWAFGAVEAMSDRICIASGQTRQDRLSAQDMVSCCSSCGDGCDGGDPGAAWDWYQRTGVVSGDLYGDNTYCQPYVLAPCDHHTTGKYSPCPAVVPTPACKNQCNSGYTKASYKADKRIASDAYQVSDDVKAIQTEIMKNGPVEVAFTVYEDLLSYKSGVYSHTSGSELGGHAVKMLGWGTENGVDYWLIANSWNEDWGDKGYFKIRRGTDECGIEDDVVAGTPKL